MSAPITSLPPPHPIDLDATALFFDLDGTLAPIEPRPDLVSSDSRRTQLLRRLEARMEGRLAVVSGRTLAVIDAVLERAVPAAAGIHGLEWRSPTGAVVSPEPPPGLATAIERFGRAADHRAGLIVEDKGLSVTLHYRLAPEAAADVLALARRTAAETGLDLQLGHMVVELKTPGSDKGGAVRAFMREPAFAGARPVFVGDDLTDEDGFAAAVALGGFGVLVGPPRSSAACFGLADPAAVLEWLDRSLALDAKGQVLSR